MTTTAKSGKLRLGLFAAHAPGWAGGEHYLLNLLAALRLRDDVIPFVYVPRDATPGLIAALGTLGATIRPLAGLTRPHPRWWLHKLGQRLDLGGLDEAETALTRDDIAVTYLRPLPGGVSKVSGVAWLPDFQHRHLPHLFDAAEQAQRERDIAIAATKARLVVLSSEAMATDFCLAAPGHADKARIVPFAVALDPAAYTTPIAPVLARHGLPERFCYFPAQLWRHKNHAVLVEALAILKQRGITPTIVCTGPLADYRHPTHAEALRAHIATLGLGDSFRLLGPIPRADTAILLRQSLALLNPSRSEGWSTTVEEARAIGKRSLLSAIPTHLEQAPPEAVYLPADDTGAWADALAQVWSEVASGPDLAFEEQARIEQPARGAAFAARFMSVVEEAAG